MFHLSVKMLSGSGSVFSVMVGARGKGYMASWLLAACRWSWIFHSWRRISKRSCSWSLKLRGSGLWLGTLQAGAELMHLVSTCIMCLLATVMTVHTTECRFTSHLEVGQIPRVPWLCRQPQCLVGVRQRLCRAILSVGLHVSLGPLTPVQTYLVANKSNKRLSL